MRSKSSLSKIFFSFLLLSLGACSSSHDDSAPAPDPVIEAARSGSLNINLADVTNEKCLNVEKYFEEVRKFPPETKVRKLASDFRLLTGNNLPRNYYLRLAAGNFQILDTTMSQISDFPEMKQNGCESVTYSAEGHHEIYKILSGKKGMVTFQNGWGGQTTVTWKSPNSVSFDVTSTVGDFLCDSSSQGRLMVTQDLNWGDASIFTESLSEKAIDPSFLSLVSDATGASLNSLYSSPVLVEPPADDAGAATPVPAMDEQPVSDRKLLVSKLKELQALPVRPELLQCY